MKSIIPSIEKTFYRLPVLIDACGKILRRERRKKKEKESIESIREKNGLFTLAFQEIGVSHARQGKGNEVSADLKSVVIDYRYVRTHTHARTVTVFRDTDFRIDYVTISRRFLVNQFTRSRYKNGPSSIQRNSTRIRLLDRYDFYTPSYTLPLLPCHEWIKMFRSIVGDQFESQKKKKNESRTTKIS